MHHIQICHPDRGLESERRDLLFPPSPLAPAFRHKWAGTPGVAVPALHGKYVSARHRGQVTKVLIGAPILHRVPEWE